MKLATFGFIALAFIGTAVSGLPDKYYSKYGKAYATLAPAYSESYTYSEGPKVNWAAWINERLLNTNQEHQKTDFATVDCDLNKNILYIDFKNINFGKDFVFDFTDDSEAQEFLVKLAQVKKRCPDVRVAIEPLLVWNQELAEQIIQKKVSVSQLVKSLTEFNIKYYTDGLAISFMPSVVLNDKLTYEFLKELKRSFTQNKLQLIFTYGPFDGLSYVRPVAFEFADLIILYTYSFSTVNRNTLEHRSPAYSADFRSVDGMIDAFVNMGAQRSKISFSVSPHGFSFKRVDCQSEVKPGCPANGLGTVVYSENTLVVKEKNIFPFYHDLPTLCRVVADPEWTKEFDEAAQAPYAYNSEQWMSYEDEQSLKAKADLVKAKKIAGVTIYPLNSDDIYNVCGNGDYSFTRLFVEALSS